MRSYIVPNLDDNDKRLLHDKGVVFHPWDTTHILIDEAQLDAALRHLSATCTSSTTDMEGIFLLKLTFTAATPNVVAEPSVVTTKPGRDPAREAARQRYIELTRSRLGEGERNARTALDWALKQLHPAREAYFQASRGDFVKKNKPAGCADLFDDQFKQLTSLEKVRSVRASSGHLFVWTRTLYATCPVNGTRHELGEFLLTIRLDGSGNFVKIFNLTRRVRTVEPGMNAPTVYADGTPSVNEIQSAWIELAAQFDFVSVVDLVIQFLESPGNDSLGRSCANWPQTKTA